MEVWEVCAAGIVLVLTHYIVFVKSAQLGIKIGIDHCNDELQKAFKVAQADKSNLYNFKKDGSNE